MHRGAGAGEEDGVDVQAGSAGGKGHVSAVPAEAPYQIKMFPRLLLGLVSPALGLKSSSPEGRELPLASVGAGLLQALTTERGSEEEIPISRFPKTT